MLWQSPNRSMSELAGQSGPSSARSFGQLRATSGLAILQADEELRQGRLFHRPYLAEPPCHVIDRRQRPPPTSGAASSSPAGPGHRGRRIEAAIIVGRRATHPFEAFSVVGLAVLLARLALGGPSAVRLGRHGTRSRSKSRTSRITSKMYRSGRMTMAWAPSASSHAFTSGASSSITTTSSRRR
jgi:hypothetical protein